MTIYEALNQIETKAFVLFGTNAFRHDIVLDTENDKHIYDLIDKICSLHAKISVKDIEFQPSIELRGQSSFRLEDITKDDFMLLESLDLSLFPLNIRARVADLLWTEKKIYGDALIAIDSYIALFNLLFSDDDWLESLDMIHRALSISTQVNQKDKHDNACQVLLNHILREGLIKLARTICERFFGAARRDFAGIIGFISRNRSKILAQNFRKMPQTHLISGSLELMEQTICFYRSI